MDRPPSEPPETPPADPAPVASDAETELLPASAGTETASLPPPEPRSYDPRAETASLGSQPGPTSGLGRVGLQPGEAFGRFVIREELGRGGMGIVYRALDQDLDREVALKLLAVELSGRPRDLQRFRREAALASKLRHPRIVSVYSFGEVDGWPFFTMPLVEGRSLKELLALQGPLHPKRAARLIQQAAQAIDSAHQQRVVHRDLKPANILIDAEDGPLVLDFGLAKDLGHGPDLTRTGEVLGTPCYMSPEQARGEAADHRVDVYALGAILYEVLTGNTPYGGETAGEVLHQILTSDPRRPREHRPDLPWELETVCLKAMAREPMFRYQTAADLADDLERFLADEPVQARRPGLLARTVRFARRHRAASVMFVLLLFTVAAAVVLTRRSAGRLAARKRSESALDDLATARRYERRGDAEGAARAYLTAFILAEEAYSDLPGDDEVRQRFLNILGQRARFAEREENWTLAEQLYERLYRHTDDPADAEALRRARGRAEVEIRGLHEGDRLEFVRWDLQRGGPDPEEVQPWAEGPTELRAGSWLASYHPVADPQREVRYLLALGRGQRQGLTVSDPGPAPPGMVYVPPARFVAGAADGDADDAPRLVEAGPLWIDRAEVTVGDYRAFLQAVREQGHDLCGPACPAWTLSRVLGVDPGALYDHTPPSFPHATNAQGEAVPVTGVTWFDAAAYAHWRGARLPSAAEWELAAGGVDGRRYPWGDVWDLGRSNFHRDEMAPVGAYPGDVSPYGVSGLAGNADEWCRDTYAEPDEGQPRQARVIRGGVWYYRPEEGGRIADGTHAMPGDRFHDTGFRCVLDAPPAPALEAAATPPRRPTPAADAQPPLTLRVAGWPRYADPHFSAEFRRRYRERTGQDVLVVQTHEITSNDELLPLLETGQVDLVTPTCDYAALLIGSGQVAPLQVSREAELLPLFQRPPFLQQEGQSYGACYAYGSMWLVARSPATPSGWDQLWSPRWRGRVAVWDDAVWTVTLAARQLGLTHLADLSDEELGRVEDHLVALLENGCRTWRTPEEALGWLRSGQVVLCDDWGIVARQLRNAGLDVRAAVPPGGSAVWIDSWMVAAGLDARRAQAAQAWIDYALSPENQRDLLLIAGYDPTNSLTVRLLDKRTARQRMRTTRQRLEGGLERWPAVPRRDRYRQTWERAKARAHGE